ncbi:hypothetical protein E3P77_03561 [Wallemia ichthyophaga]|nr:hypothetical protein E3P77_03561 [Wallemia ichthyophaga]
MAVHKSYLLQAVSVTRRRNSAQSTYLPSFEWDVNGGCDGRLAAFQQSRQSLHHRARQVMDTLLEGVADNALSVLQKSPDVNEEDAIPTCVLVSHEPSSNIVILRRLDQLNQNTHSLLTLELGWQDFGSNPTLQSGVRSIVLGLLSKYADDDAHKRYIKSALNSTDFNTIHKWYKDSYIQDNPPKLVLTLRDFEALPPPMVQDLVSLLTHYRKYIPINLVLCIDSSPAAIYRLLPRYTIIKLAMTQVAAPSANTTFEAIIGELFFSTTYNSPITLSSSAFDVLYDTFNHSHNSFEHLLHTLDMQLLDHFFQPYSIFFDTDAVSVESIKDDRVWRYLLSLPSTISYLKQGREAVDRKLCNELLAEKVNSEGLLKSLRRLRKVFKQSVDEENDAFRALQHLRSFIHSVVPDSKDFLPNAKAQMQAKTHGDLAKIVDKTLQSVSLMSKAQLYEWLSGYADTKSSMKSDQLATKQLMSFMDKFTAHGEIKLNTNEQSTRDPDFVEFTQTCAEEWTQHFIVNLVEERLIPFEEIWRVGVSSDLQMLVNPSPRHAILTALRYPQKLLGQHYPEISLDEAMSSDNAPDTCLAFKCYIEAARVFNLSDWFSAFKSVLESGSDQSKKSKKRKKAGDEDEETIQLQARFTQAVNELDSMGFVKKASARNRNIVARTVFMHVEGDDDEKGVGMETIAE